jgi:hypothetical protein
MEGLKKYIDALPAKDREEIRMLVAELIGALAHEQMMLERRGLTEITPELLATRGARVREHCRELLAEERFRKLLPHMERVLQGL